MSSARADAMPMPSLDAAVGRVRRAGRQPLRAAFLARGLNALARLADTLEERKIGDAIGAPSDYATLLTALETADAVAVLRQDDPLAPARLRGLEMRSHLLEMEGGVLGVEDVARHLAISRQAVDKRRKAGRLIGLSVGRRGYAYPAWQFGAGGLLSGLEETLSGLTVRDPWMQAAFFVSGNSYLGGASPLDVLRQGDVAAAQRAAQAFGAHGAP